MQTQLVKENKICGCSSEQEMNGNGFMRYALMCSNCKVVPCGLVENLDSGLDWTEDWTEDWTVDWTEFLPGVCKSQ